MRTLLQNRWFTMPAFCALLIVAPLILRSEYVIHCLVLTFILAIFALGYDLVVGRTGQVSLGHQAFFGVGAYVTAVLAVRLQLSPWLCLPACLIFALILSVVIGYISLRMRGAFFAIVTLAFAMMIWLFVKGWRGVTGGEFGIVGIPPLTISIPLLPRITFDSPFSFYYLTLAFLLLSIYCLSRVLDSRLGRAVAALRENEERASTLGINALRYYIVVFALGGMVSSLAGFAYAAYMASVTPIVLSVNYMIKGLIMIIVGGSGTLGGPLLGAFIVVLIPELLRATQELQLIFFGVVLVVFVILMPQGIYPSLVRLWKRKITPRR